MTRFPYEKIQASPSFADPVPFIYRPTIPLTIYGLTKVYLTKGLLDTGAEETILPRSLLDGRELDPAIRMGEVDELRGADGRLFEVTYGTVDLAVKLRRKTYRWHAKVAFHVGRNEVLLGDAGFLRYFVATFNRPALYTTLKPVG